MQRPCDAIDTMLMPSSTVMNSVVILVLRPLCNVSEI